MKEQPLAEPMAVPPSPTASTWNIANGLTVFRLVLVPIFVLVLFVGGGHHDGWRWLAAGVFAVASYTDRIDGQLARSRNLVTSFGKLVDPIADKALIGAALIGLSLLDELPWWITVLILVRELGVTLLRFWVIRHGVIPASRGGKLKAFVQAVAIGLYLFPLSGWFATGRAYVMGLAIIVTVVTGVDYVTRAVTLRQTSERAAMKRARKAARQR